MLVVYQLTYTIFKKLFHIKYPFPYQSQHSIVWRLQQCKLTADNTTK